QGEAYVARPCLIALTLEGETTAADEMARLVESVEAPRLFSCFYQDAAAVGFHCLRRGEWTRARAYLEPRLATFRERNNVAAALGCAVVLGTLELAEGHRAHAKELLASSLLTCQKGGDVLLELWILPVLADLHLEEGQPARAAECVERGFHLMTPGRSWYGLPAPLEVARGALATGAGDWATAEAAFAAAIEIDRRYRLPWDEAQALAAWGRMHLARGNAGDRGAGRDKLGQALAIFERVRARRDAERVRAALAGTA
ncbi:MAG TPA: hypothetical protein VLI67_04190, partial [Vicinamibacteria bacterium]|nr:hypothetical protein [Vicinamibacteria bacterium]